MPFLPPNQQCQSTEGMRKTTRRASKYVRWTDMASSEREPITGVWRRRRLDRLPSHSSCKNSLDLYQFQERPLAKVGGHVHPSPPRGDAIDHTRPGWTTPRRGQDSQWKSIRVTEDRDKSRKYICIVWPTLGSATAKEQNRTEHNACHITNNAVDNTVFEMTGNITAKQCTKFKGGTAQILRCRCVL